MQALETRIPPPLVFILFGLLMLGASRFDQFASLSHGLASALINLLLVIASIFSFGGMLGFRRAKTTINPLQPHKASSLVTSGVYRISRNPMYVGLALFLLALGVKLGSLWSYGCIPLFVIFINRFQILPEERALQDKFGAEFEQYRSTVRRWL